LAEAFREEEAVATMGMEKASGQQRINLLEQLEED